MNRVCIHEIEYHKESRYVLSGTGKYPYNHIIQSRKNPVNPVYTSVHFCTDVNPYPELFIYQDNGTIG